MPPKEDWYMLGGSLRAALSVSALLVALPAFPGSGNVPPVSPPAAAAVTLDSAILSGYRWRSIGPDRGGRSIGVSGVRGQPKVAYFGATGGGLWKTTDGGETWAPVTDGQITSASVGAVAVSETNPDIVYIGMGEAEIRGNILAGDGVYKSTDAGKTWTHVGFHDSDAIAKIRVHPTNPDIVFVASFGKYGVPSEERGLYKSTDGGKTWKRVLYRDAKTGAVEVVFDRTNPNVMDAALWEAFRNEWQMSSGGPGSGLFKSTDGGETWTELTRNPGLPSGVDGKIGVAVSPADPNRVYALIENANGGLFRSDDAGATWTLVNSDRNIRQRAFYYTHVIADPKDADKIYLLNVSAFRSTDGGKTIENLGRGTHGDYHDLWIDPDDPQHLVVGNDGGGAVSTNGGESWTEQDFPTPQFYHVVTTNHEPYHVCGSQQDSNELCVPSDIGRGSSEEDIYSPGGSENGYIAPDPLDLDVFYSGTNANGGGFLTKLDLGTGQRREVSPYPRMFSGEASSELVERWQWTYPIVFSPVDPHTLYASSQHVWKTTDGGQTWERISPDLTRHDPKTMGPSGGPITKDMNGPEVYAVVFALAPSKRSADVIWAGSDDGLVHVTRDGGKTWTNVTPPDMPDFGRVSIIDASAFDDGSAYVAVKRPLLGDRAPYIFRTHDFGKTWTKIVDGLPADDYVHVVREDSTRRGLLYAGTQRGVWISYDDGAHWSSLSLNLPALPVVDLAVEDNSLAIATHGRGFYILDDIAALRQYQPAMADGTAPVLFEPAVAIRSSAPAAVQYWLKRPVNTLKLEILDAAGHVAYSVVSDSAARARADSVAAARRGGGGGGFRRGGGPDPLPSVKAGLQRVTWDLRYPDATSFPGMILWGGSTAGPTAPPGTYQVRLTADGQTLTQPLVVRRNPMFADVTDADLQKQFALAIQIRDKVSEANEAVIRIRDLKAQVADRLKRSQDAQLETAGDRLTRSLSAVEEAIYQVRNQSGQDPLNFPIKINNRLASLLSITTRGDGAPTSNIAPIFEDLKRELKVQTDRLDQVLATDLAAFNAQARRAGVAAVGREVVPE
ncbi:MAG TPA: glycosyl hydrolase [Gemmatimonadaceae bacterium]|nr:glycosyl hydrolase [Gemmatimonadaceae bacterium]